MATIEGDIDLTQNLDFYRKKPKKLLPANANLLSRKESNKKSIKISSNNNTIYYSYNITDYWSTTTTGYYDLTSTIDLNYSTIKNNKKENKFSFWKSRKNKEILSSLTRCNSCKHFILFPSSKNNICKNCNKLMNSKRYKWCIEKNYRDGYKFEFVHNNKSSYNNYYYYPWDKKEKIKEYENNSRYDIPWFQKLNYRIYNDYITDLIDGEQDYSSYLTNMRWLNLEGWDRLTAI